MVPPAAVPAGGMRCVPVERDRRELLGAGVGAELVGVARRCLDGDIVVLGEDLDDGAPDGPGGAGDEDGFHGRRPVTTTARPGSSSAPSAS